MASTQVGHGLDKGSIVNIKVQDESREIKREFACERARLLKEMKYFEEFLGNKDDADLEISVHCDVYVFEWLVRWVHFPEDTKIETKSVVSILISSEFLLMERLVSQCLQYIASHINDILNLPIDLGCLSDTLVGRLADLMDANALSTLHDRRTTLLPKLYKRRIHKDFTLSPYTFERCQYCNQLYHRKIKSRCTLAPLSIDMHGNLSQCHTPLKTFQFTEYITNLHAREVNSLSWSQIYWLLWASSRVFTCQICGTDFTGDQIHSCSYHPNTSTLHTSSSRRVYKCCNALDTSGSFRTMYPSLGCKTKNHIAVDTPETILLDRQTDTIIAALAKQQGAFAAKQISEKSEKSSSSQAEAKTSTEKQSDVSKKKIHRPPTARASNSGKETNRSKTSRRTARSARPAAAKINSLQPKEENEQVVKSTPSLPRRLRPEHSVFLNNQATEGLTLAQLIGEPTPAQSLGRRAWEIECFSRDDDLARLKRIESTLRAFRKPWPLEHNKSPAVDCAFPPSNNLDSGLPTNGAPRRPSSSMALQAPPAGASPENLDLSSSALTKQQQQQRRLWR